MTRQVLGGNEFSFAALTASIALAIVAGVFVGTTHAQQPAQVGAPNYAPQVDMRSGGVVAQSYGYHRQSPAANAAVSPFAAKPGTWYGYGFPVETYRWGWFGAAHYYPTVLWHTGYYNDQCRWAYRRGY